jgi:xanthine dehydrogenase YagS FAD-binding subunit
LPLHPAAVALELNGDRVDHARIALGGVATRPWRAHEAERVLAGQRLTPEIALAAGRAAFREARPGRHNGFKIELGARTVADAVLIAAERSRS